MNTKRFLLLWHAFAFSYLLVFGLIIAVFPELETFRFLTKKYGFIDIENWDFYYLLLTSVVALIINNALVVIAFMIRKRACR